MCGHSKKMKSMKQVKPSLTMNPIAPWSWTLHCEQYSVVYTLPSLRFSVIPAGTDEDTCISVNPVGMVRIAVMAEPLIGESGLGIFIHVWIRKLPSLLRPKPGSHKTSLLLHFIIKAGAGDRTGLDSRGSFINLPYFGEVNGSCVQG